MIIVPPWLYDRIAEDPVLAGWYGVTPRDKGRFPDSALLDLDDSRSFFDCDHPWVHAETRWSNK